MSYNDRTDVESALQTSVVPPVEPILTTSLAVTSPPPSAQLQQAPTPPAATPAGVRGTAASPNAGDPLPRTIASPPTPVAVPANAGAGPGGVPVPLSTALSTSAPLQTPPAARPSTVQPTPQSPAATQTVTPLTPGKLISNTQTALQQNPTGTMQNISTLTPQP